MIYRFLRDFITGRDYYALTEHKNANADPLEASSKYSFPSSNGPVSFNVLTLNTALLPVHAHVEERCIAIANILGAYDIVTLQEVFHAKEITFLQQAGEKAGLIHRHYFDGGNSFPLLQNLEGTGMLVLSRFPIVETMYKRFSLNGKPYKFHHADYYAHKGVGLCRILTHNGGMVDLYATHLHACYVDYIRFKGKKVYDEYLSHRVAQAFELAQFVRATSHNSLVILAGDFNSSPDSTCLQCIKYITGLNDGHKDDILTFGTPDNTYGKNKYIEQKLDYILYKAQKGWSISKTEVLNEEVLINNISTSISDHCGLVSTFTFTPSSGTIEQSNVSEKILDDIVIQISNDGVTILDSVVMVVKDGLKDAQKRFYSHRRRMTLVFLLIILYVIIDCIINFDAVDSSVFFRLFMVICGIVLAVEFVMSQYVVQSEIRNTVVIVQEAERMRDSLKYYIQHLDYALSRCKYIEGQK